jgi:phage shock protein C
MIQTQLKRTSGDKMVAGVCGGLARYFNVDPAIVRLLFVVAVFIAGVSPLVYALLWIVMPLDTAVPEAPAAPALPYHPRPAEEWKFDPYTGERVQRES